MRYNYAIICSNLDNASVNIKEALIEDFKFKEADSFFGNKVFNKGNINLYTVNKELVFSENLDNDISADFFIFASKHQSKTEIPTLTVHSIGNWGLAELGGIKNKLVLSSALLQRDLFVNLNKINYEGFEIVNEATHHGPFLNKPSVFIEIGSTEKEWNNKEVAKEIAKVIINTVDEERKKVRVAVGLGGLHTCTNFNKLILNNDIAISHFCPKYALKYLNKVMINEAIEKTLERVDFLLLDWKGLKDEKQKLLNIINELGLNYRKNSEF